MSRGAHLFAPGRITWLTIVVHGLTVFGAIFGAYYWTQLTIHGGQPYDASTYYRIRLDDLYGGWVVGGEDSFQYAPVFGQVIAILRVLPFDVFVAVWRAAAIIVVVRLAGPLTLPALLLAPVASEINAGNVNVFLAGAIALGFTRPASWTLVLLTKITPGIGLLWFVVRREWRALRSVALVTAIVVGLSFVIAPGQWLAWFGLILNHSADSVATYPYYVPLAVRLPLAAILALIGARLGRRWMIPIAAMIAAPVLYFPTQSIALGALPFVRQDLGILFERLLARARSGGRMPPDSPVAKPGQVSAEGDDVPVEVVG